MKIYIKLAIVAAIGYFATTQVVNAQEQEKADWGDFKLWIDPGHSKKENQGMYGYTEAQKVLRVRQHSHDPRGRHHRGQS